MSRRPETDTDTESEPEPKPENHVTRMSSRGVPTHNSSVGDTKTSGKIWVIFEAVIVYDGTIVTCDICEEQVPKNSNVLHNGNTDYCMGCIFKHQCNRSCDMRRPNKGGTEVCTDITPCESCIDNFKKIPD